MNQTVRRLLAFATGTLVAGALKLGAQSAPTITAQPVNQAVPPGTNVSFSITVNGTAPLSYQWQLNGGNLPNNLILTVVGNGSSFYSGEGGRALNTTIGAPKGLAFDRFGNLYVADTGNNRIRKMSTNGVVTTVAGRNSGGFSGDGGAATNASLSGPYAVTPDAAGNLYIADASNNRVRKVDLNGIITTVAGNGASAYAGDGGAATNAGLNPLAVALDATGNLYVADANNSRVRRVDTNGVITTLAGNGVAQYAGDGGAATQASLNHPSGVALDAVGNVYVADTGNHCIRRVDAQGIITTVAGNGTGAYSGDGGAATNASFSAPRGLALDGLGNLFIADTTIPAVRRVDTNGIITTVAGNGSAGYLGDGGVPTNARLNAPWGLTTDRAGNLYIADSSNNRIRKVWLSASYPLLLLPNVDARNVGGYTVIVTNIYDSITSAVATLALQAPAIITAQPVSRQVMVGSSPAFSVTATGLGPFGYLWFFNNTNLIQADTNSTLTLANVSLSDSGSYTVVITNAYGSVTSRVASLTAALPPVLTGQPVRQTVWAGTNVSLTVAVSGVGPFSYQWLCNGSNLPNNLITTVAGNGSGAFYSGDGVPATNVSLYYPQGVGFDAVGNLFIADNNNNRVHKVDAAGILTTVAGDGYGATNGSGRYAGDGGLATNASLYRPNNLAWDALGNLYIADIFNHRIRKVDTQGIITTVAGDGNTSPGADNSGDGGPASVASLYYPACVAFDGPGNWYIADLNNHRIRKVDPYGIITTVAGKAGSSGYSGDGGPATNASLYFPQGVCVDSAGNLFIADSSNHRVRKVDINGIITTVAGGGTNTDGSAATNASLSQPWGVALDALGQLYIADVGSHRVRKVDTHGIISTVAGNGIRRYAGDGGAATNASLNQPACVALDAAGNLFIADWYNDRIREVHLAGDPTYALTDVKVANAGDYSVIVTSPYGSITSAVATVTVNVPRTPPQLLTSDGAFGFKANKFGFNINGAPGQTIVVDGSTNLSDWAPLFTNTVDTNTIFYFGDAFWTNFPARYYRARLP